jgi:hypothetical protein
MILGMAINCYKYDPTAAKNDAISKIETSLINVGISISKDTIRSKLDEAKEFLPPEWRKS